MDNFEYFRRAAAEVGYELAHGEEGAGDHFRGLMILVQMSNRKIVEADRRGLYRAADQIKKSLGAVSAEIDPEGPALRGRYRAEIADIYSKAGVEPIYVEPRPNGYCSEPCCLNKPWFRVTSRIGHVVIGWCKQVMAIDWTDSLITKSGEELFPDQDVPRTEHGIHAWGVEKAALYIRRLHDVAGGGA